MSIKKFHLHLISDSTGETLTSVSRAVMSQFIGVTPEEHLWSLVRSKSQIDRVLEEITNNPGIVIYTILERTLRDSLKIHCNNLQIPCIPVLSPIINEFSAFLGMHPNNTVGRQHDLDDEYFSKVEAINYTLSHDDGQSTWDLYDADIVVIGVSRTSKSPTSVYLSYRGYKTANVPFVSNIPLPESLFDLTTPLIVGLTISPDRLVQIRKNRLLTLQEDRETDYIELEEVEKEIAQSRRVFAKLGCPVIDVTRRSVEETAAKIIQYYQERKANIIPRL